MGAATVKPYCKELAISATRSAAGRTTAEARAFDPQLAFVKWWDGIKDKPYAFVQRLVKNQDTNHCIPRRRLLAMQSCDGVA
jgi:hypothetical protein